MRKSSDFLAALLTAFRTPTYCSFLGVINLDFFFLIFILLGGCWGRGRISCSVITGVWGEFSSSQCNPSAKAAFRSAKVMDLKEYEVGLEVAACWKAYSWACVGYFLAKQWHKIPVLVKVLDGNAQNMWLCMFMCFFHSVLQMSVLPRSVG